MLIASIDACATLAGDVRSLSAPDAQASGGLPKLSATILLPDGSPAPGAVIELHNLVFRGGDPKGPELIANNAIHSGVVRGSGRLNPAAPLVTDLAIRFDGDIVDRWDAIRWPDDVLQAVRWLTDNLARSGLHLQRGQTILTGALGPPLPVAHVDHVEVLSSQFGSVAARFE